MKSFNLILLFFCLSIGGLMAQCLNNPSIQAGDIDPAPLINGQGGMLSFTYTENGADYTDEETDPVTVSICLSNIAPDNGVASIGGTFAATFTWQYDGGMNCFLGTQNQDILGGTGGTITVTFDQTNSIACPDNQMGFNANIQPAACMNATNQVNDDNEASYTCNQMIAQPSLAVTNVTVDEDAGTASVNVCANEVLTTAVTFDYTSNDDTAGGSDYTALSASGSIGVGEQCTTLTFSITDDSDAESPESFFVDISNPTNSIIGDGQGIVTINDNDVACAAAAPTLSSN